MKAAGADIRNEIQSPGNATGSSLIKIDGDYEARVEEASYCLDKALEWLDKAINIHPDAANEYRSIGYVRSFILDKTRHIAEAISATQTEISQNPDNAEAFRLLQKLKAQWSFKPLLATGNKEGEIHNAFSASSALIHSSAKVLDMNPLSIQTSPNTGEPAVRFPLQRDKLSEAEMQFDPTLITIIARVTSGRVKISLLNPQLDGIIQETLLEEGNQVSVIRFGFGALSEIGAIQIQNEAEAQSSIINIHAFHVFRRLGPPIRLFHYLRRMVEEGNARAGCERIENLLPLHPEDHSLIKLYIRGLIALDEHEKALHYYKKLMGFMPHDSDVYFSIARSIMLFARVYPEYYEKALTILDKGMSVDPGNALIAIDAALANTSTGRYGKAQMILKQMIAQYPKARFTDDCIAYEGLLSWFNEFKKSIPGRYPAPSIEKNDKYVIVIVAWGEQFIRNMEQYALPSFLAPGNLPYISGYKGSRLLFFTTEEFQRRLEVSPAVKALKGVIENDIITFPDHLMPRSKSSYNKYILMSMMHMSAIEVARHENAHFMFLAPDIIISDNYLRSLDERRALGKDVIFAGGFSLNLESFRQETPGANIADFQPLIYSPAELMRRSLGHLHDDTKRNIFSNNSRRASFSHTLWPLENGGYELRGFHLTPYIVSSKMVARYDGSFFMTIDGEFLTKIIRTPEDLETCDILTDAGQTNYFELSQPSRNDYYTIFDMERVHRWASMQGPLSRMLFQQPIFFDPNLEFRSDANRCRSDEIAQKIIENVDRLSAESKVSEAIDEIIETMPG